MKVRRRRRARMEDFLPSEVVQALDLVTAGIEIAEEEIRAAYPQKGEPPGLFSACAVPVLLQGLDSKMYRAHVRELVARSRSRRPDYAPATESEILAALLRAATVAPLRHSGMLLADTLFTRIFGWKFRDEPTREEWPGQFEEELRAARLNVRTGR